MTTKRTVATIPANSGWAERWEAEKAERFRLWLTFGVWTWGGTWNGEEIRHLEASSSSKRVLGGRIP